MVLLQNCLEKLHANTPKHTKGKAWCVYGGILVGVLWTGAIAPTVASSPAGRDCISSTSRNDGRLDRTADDNCKSPTVPSNSSTSNSSTGVPYTIWVPGQPERTPPSEYYPANCQPLPSGVTSADWQYFAELYRCKYGDHD